jgi:sn-glycerol 3-phosphate transport system ATP-binding protein
MATLVLEGLRKSFGATPVLHGIDLSLASGEMLVIVGASGCGKSTLLRLVAGLETPSGGRIVLDGRDVAKLDPAARDIAMVFQNYALYPHMTVFENMAYGLKIRGLTRDEVRRRVEESAGLLGLGELLARKPRQLSGGQRQRVAMGRAIVREPKLFLFDEPLSNLDAKLRVTMRAEIRRLQRHMGVTSLYVTHDQVEAMTLGDRLLVLHKGVPVQLATPMEVFDRPADLYVAGFIGAPSRHRPVDPVRRWPQTRRGRAPPDHRHPSRTSAARPRGADAADRPHRAARVGNRADRQARGQRAGVGQGGRCRAGRQHAGRTDPGRSHPCL